MAPLRVLIADDERPARKFLANLLATLPDVELVGEASNGKEAVEGHYCSTHYHPEVSSPKSKAFVEAYKKRFKNSDGSPKAPDAMAALGYDSAMILAEAMKRSGSTEGPKVRDALAATKDFDGVTGRTIINEKKESDKK